MYRIIVSLGWIGHYVFLVVNLCKFFRIGIYEPIRKKLVYASKIINGDLGKYSLFQICIACGI